MLSWCIYIEEVNTELWSIPPAPPQELLAIVVLEGHKSTLPQKALVKQNYSVAFTSTVGDAPGVGAGGGCWGWVGGWEAGE